MISQISNTVNIRSVNYISNNSLEQSLKESVCDYIDKYVNMAQPLEKEQLLIQYRQAVKLAMEHIKTPGILNNISLIKNTSARALYSQLVDDPEQRLHQLFKTPNFDNFMKFIEQYSPTVSRFKFDDKSSLLMANMETIAVKSKFNLLANITIKTLDKKDVDSFKEVRLECLKNEPSAFRTKYSDEIIKPHSYWENLFSSKGQIFFGLFVGDSNLVSIANLTKDADGQWWVVGVYTKPEFRGNKLVINLMNHIISFFQNANLGHRLLLKVLSTNIPAIKTYKKLGFTTIESLPNQLMGDGEYHVQYLMQLVTNRAKL